MKLNLTSTSLIAVILWTTTLFAAQTQPRYPVDPQSKWAIGAKQTPADELKKRLEAGKMLIIDVRAPEQFHKETIPGAINTPLEELEGHLKKMAKDTYIVFTWGSGRISSQAAKLAEELGFQSTTFCPVNQWKEQGNQTEPGKKNWDRIKKGLARRSRNRNLEYLAQSTQRAQGWKKMTKAVVKRLAK